MMRHLRITVDGRVYDVVVEDVTQASGPVTTTPMPGPLVAQPEGARMPAAGTGGSSPPAPTTSGPAVAGGADNRLAPLAGVVLEINVKIGDTVEVDDPLLVLEAMKMKTVIGAHKAGKVTAIHVKPGDAVDADQALVTIAG
ncbi:MAG: biotin/lipoyl-containing protein [Xanthobacteraceae bacterium]